MGAVFTVTVSFSTISDDTISNTKYKISYDSESGLPGKLFVPESLIFCHLLSIAGEVMEPCFMDNCRDRNKVH